VNTIRSAFLTFLAAAAPALAQAPSARPNIVFLVSDDQNADTIAALGNPHIRTPNLDRLVENGFAFTRAYCLGSTVPAVCVPSRAMFLTGRTLFRVNNNIAAGHVMLPQALSAAGYATFGTGKWHNGAASYARAFAGGGPVFFGGMSDQFRVSVQDFDPAGKYEKARAKIGGAFSSELFADAAVRFLRNHTGDKPFFLYVSFTAPHDPRTPPGKYAGMYDPAKLPLPAAFTPQHPFDNGEMKVRDELLAPHPRTPEVVRRHTADYYGMISHLDEQVGRIVAALEQTGKSKNTVIVFFSDHGLALGRHGLFGKQNLYDHSMRAPLIFAGPGVPRGGKSDALCRLSDIYPTVCDLAGVPIPATVEGKSLAGLIAGKATSHCEAIFTAYRDVQRAVRTDRWKLIHYPKIGRTQLFDLAADPEELKDLSAEAALADTLKSMMERLRRMQAEFGDPTARGN
jgi:arylsulfatase A-like enzyme